MSFIEPKETLGVIRRSLKAKTRNKPIAMRLQLFGVFYE